MIIQHIRAHALIWLLHYCRFSFCASEISFLKALRFVGKFDCCKQHPLSYFLFHISYFSFKQRNLQRSCFSIVLKLLNRLPVIPEKSGISFSTVLHFVNNLFIMLANELHVWFFAQCFKRMFCHFLCLDTKKVTKEKSSTDDNCSGIFWFFICLR